MHKMKSKSPWKEIASDIIKIARTAKVVTSVTKITVGKNEK